MSQPELSPEDVSGKSNVRGCGFGCLYMVGAWLVFGIVAALLLPAIFQGPQWDHQALGRFAGQLSFLVMIPIGIFGFIRHRRKRR